VSTLALLVGFVTGAILKLLQANWMLYLCHQSVLVRFIELS